MPGRKNDAGETLWEPLKPPQPVINRIIAGTIANRNHFQLNLISTFKYKLWANMLAIVISRAFSMVLGLGNRRKSIGGCPPLDSARIATDVWHVQRGSKSIVLTKVQSRVRTLISPKVVLAIAFMLFSSRLPARPDSGLSSAAAFSRQAEAAYKDARKRVQAEPDNSEAEWQFGRTCFDWADYANSNAERAKIAEEGISACRKVVDRDIQSAPGHYYLALNLGQLARTKMLGALKIVEQMEAEYKLALSLDPKFDYAGADRGLGLLYYDAPGWPTSIGSKTKAHLHLQRALTTSPDYPENYLNLIEADFKWGDRNGALRELKALDGLWPSAKQRFIGDAWASSWADWEKRREELQKKASETPKVLESPRMK